MRKRRVAKWVGTVLSLIIAFAYIYSTRRAVSWRSPDLNEANLMLGAVCYGWIRDDAPVAEWKNPPKPGWSHARYGGPPKLRWWIVAGDTNKYWRGVIVPLWMPFVVLAVPTTVLWWRDRRETARAWRRMAKWIAPRRRKRVTVWQVLLFCALHSAALFFGVIVFEKAYTFFVDSRLSDPVYRALEHLLPVLFWTTPLWALFWAWLWTKLHNALIARQPGEHCFSCGYNLTGNVSGTCPECGDVVDIAKVGR